MVSYIDILFKFTNMFLMCGVIYYVFVHYVNPLFNEEIARVTDEENALKDKVNTLKEQESVFKKNISHTADEIEILKQKVSFWNHAVGREYAACDQEKQKNTENLVLLKQKAYQLVLLHELHKKIKLLAIEKSRDELLLFFNDPAIGKQYINSIVQMIDKDETWKPKV